MVIVTQTAQGILTDYFQDKEIAPIRIFLQSGG